MTLTYQFLEFTSCFSLASIIDYIILFRFTYHYIVFLFSHCFSLIKSISDLCLSFVQWRVLPAFNSNLIALLFHALISARKAHLPICPQPDSAASAAFFLRAAAAAASAGGRLGFCGRPPIIFAPSSQTQLLLLPILQSPGVRKQLLLPLEHVHSSVVLKVAIFLKAAVSMASFSVQSLFLQRRSI
ncbi:uncharacterized protein ASCRUDRAFT_97776 [Ascoidea rubescens DSM 1968]|uniref:Uncharacterized protein n=1 Tax=Ascoidea rubescens DSM 1968 TaxID=1344418 RepID=A0A1D2VPW2_9ASCO|nr:hypothetical protein ASCRUDRAFT_97776 [Ascoidea rubescens DSM 1968]ODV63636.1 hypothetical protein ASCRUDRAFT_97776 [Ascoidea rubescens DSM 1968]